MHFLEPEKKEIAIERRIGNIREKGNHYRIFSWRQEGVEFRV